MARWKNKTNPDPFIQKMEATRSIKENGQVQFTGDDILTVPARIENLVELNSLVTQEDKHTIVWRAIRNAGKQRLSSGSVIKEIEQLEKEYLSTKVKKFILITTLSLNSLKHTLKNCQIDHNRITFTRISAKKFIKHLNESQNIKYHLGKNKIPKDYMWVRVAVDAKSIHEATQKALRSLNLFRGMLNYLVNFGKRSFSSNMKPQPINKIHFGPIHTLHKPNGGLVDDIFWYDEDFIRPVKAYNDILQGNFEKLIDFLPIFRKQLNRSKIKKILEDALLLYNSALDSYSFDTAFIKLWATLELLTGTGRDSYDITVKRTSFIFNDVEEIKSHLNILRDCRNDIVHKGYMEGQKEILIYDIKLYVEQLLEFLLWEKEIKRLDTFDEVKQLLSSSPDKKELGKKIKIYNMAQKFHR